MDLCTRKGRGYYDSDPTDIAAMIFLDQHRTKILHECERAARAGASGAAPFSPRSGNRMTELLDLVHAMSDAGEAIASHVARQYARTHLEAGVELADIAADLSILREGIFTVWASDLAENEDRAAGRSAYQAIDRATGRLLVELVRQCEARHAPQTRREDPLAEAPAEAPVLSLRKSELEGLELELGRWDVTTGEVDISLGCREALGLGLQTRLSPKTLLRLVPPNERRAVTEALRCTLRARTSDVSTRVQRIVRATDQQERWLAIRARVARDDEGLPTSIVATFRDVTDHKVAEERAQLLADASRAFASSLDIQTTLEHVAQAVVPRFADGCSVNVIGEDGTVGNFVTIKGLTDEQSEHVQTLMQRTSPLSSVQVLQSGKSKLVSHVSEADLRKASSDPEFLEFVRRLPLTSWLAIPLAAAGSNLGILSLAQMRSGRHFKPSDIPFAEELAARASAAIVHARMHEAMAREVRVRDRMISLLSHDLRTPLSAIDLGAALMLDAGMLNEDSPARRQAMVIRRNAMRIAMLVNDFLDLVNLQCGKLRLNTRVCELAKLVHQAVKTQRDAARAAGLELCLDMELSGQRIRCDRPRLREALSRTLGFAVERSAPGRTIHVRGAATGEFLRISIEDAGVKDLEELEQVFEWYWKGKAAQERAAGLGLVIARELVNLHEGRLRLEDRPGGRTAFEIVLPHHTPKGSTPETSRTTTQRIGWRTSRARPSGPEGTAGAGPRRRANT